MKTKCLIIGIVCGMVLPFYLKIKAQQLATEGHVEGFSLPLYNRENQIQAKIFGSRAQFPEENKIQIFDLKAELYEGGRLQATLISPEALFLKEEQRLNTWAPVSVNHEKMQIQSRTLEWDMVKKEARFEQNVIVRLYIPSALREEKD